MTMRSLGLSIYPDHSNFEDNAKYLELGHKYGFSRIFMSMLEVQGSPAETQAKYKKIIEYGNKLGYQTFLDVSPQLFDQLGISYSDLKFFADTGAAGIRLDQAFDGATEAMLSYNPYGLIIELNMSNNVDYLNNIISYQANTPFIYGCHNFLEQDRNLPIDVQAMHLFASGLIDDVIIGNAYASEEELRALSEVNRYQLMLHVDYVKQISDIEKTIVEKPQHFRRGDMNEIVIRSTMPRVTYKDIPNPPHDNEEEFQRGDVLIGNDNFGIYKNELQIVLKPHKEPRKNKIGSIAKDELFLLDFIKPWTKFKLTGK